MRHTEPVGNGIRFLKL